MCVSVRVHNYKVGAPLKQHSVHASLLFVAQFMEEMSSAWQWSVEKRMGLFSGDEQQPSPFVFGFDCDVRPHTPLIAPHQLWIKVRR